MDLIIIILPVVTKYLHISPRFTPYDVSSRCKFSNLTTRTHVPALFVTKEEHKSYFGKNRTHAFRTSRCARYLQDHSGDYNGPNPMQVLAYIPDQTP